MNANQLALDALDWINDGHHFFLSILILFFSFSAYQPTVFRFRFWLLLLSISSLQRARRLCVPDTFWRVNQLIHFAVKIVRFDFQVCELKKKKSSNDVAHAAQTCDYAHFNFILTLFAGRVCRSSGPTEPIRCLAT